MKKLQMVWAGIAVVLAIILTLQAQETAIPVHPIFIHAPVSSSEDDLATMIQAVELTTPQPADSAPTSGTFWSAQNPNFPPFPGNLNNTPVWNLGDNVWLLDDRDVDYNARTPLFSRGGGGGMHAMDEGPPSPGDGDGGDGTNTFYGSPAPAVDYGTNLWIAQVAVVSNNFVGIGTNTQADIEYEIQSRTNLLETNWESEGFILGSELTNWTPLSVAENGRTNLFLRLRSWADDGSGLPIWWQLQYFGYIGVDPYGDPMGDGWNNLQKFQYGWDPNVFYTPPGPQGVIATLNPTNSTVSLTWQPANGAVTGYTITRSDPDQTNYFVGPSTTTFTVGLTNQFVDTNYPAYGEDEFEFLGASTYTVQADYASGNSYQVSGVSPYSASAVPTVVEMSGAGGATTLLVTHIPPGVSGIELERSDLTTNNYPPLTGLPGTNLLTSSAYADYPVSDFTNGVFNIPTNMVYTTPYGSFYHLQAIWPDGSKSAVVNAGAPQPIFYDGRTQLEQNVSFLLQAAGLTNPFAYELPDGYEAYQPSNYTFASYYDAAWSGFGTYYPGIGDYSAQDWQRPFEDNYNYRNFLYGNNTNLNSGGFLNTGCAVDGDGNYSLSSPVFQFNAPLNGASIPNLGQSTYAPPYTDYTRLGMYVNGSSQFVLPNNIYNYFGLHLASVLIAHSHSGTLYLDSLSAGYTWPKTNDTYYFYPQFDQPELATVGYYFGRINGNSYDGYNPIASDPMPGNSNFSPSTPQPLIIVGMDGLPWQLAAFAKKIITNGDTSKPVYVEQYFDKAYKVDASGNVTTTQTGVLSPKGDFFPTEPGPVALVTMPDINTGQRGTNIIYVVSLQLDANHDGVMDSSYFGQDETLGATFNFWLNDGYDEPGVAGGLDKDLPVEGAVVPNYSYGQIRCQRNLENFARLWVCGLPQFPVGQGYSVSLGTDPNYGLGLNLYPACETNGDTSYLTDTNVAAAQLATGYVNGQPVNFGNALAQVGGYYATGLQDYTLPLDSYGNPWLTNFLFEGSSYGSGNLVLTIYQSNNIVAQAVAPMNMDTIKNYYEQAHIAGLTNEFPAMINLTNASTFVSDYELNPNPYEAKQLITFVHGWRMGIFDYGDFSDTMFKRLYWAGYQGRFSSLRWPTLSKDDYKNLPEVLADFNSYFTYNRSEYIAHRSADGASAYFDWLKLRLPDYSINVAAHSMGNIVMMDTLKLELASGSHDIDNYVMMQAAVPAHCYDTSFADYSLFTTAENSSPFSHTPDVYRGYPGNIAAAVNGNIVNFFNTNDFALATGTFLTANVSWEGNEVSYKPDGHWDYYSDGTNCFETVLSTTRTVTNPREQMGFVARPRSKAAGALPGVAGEVSGGEVDLTGQFHFLGNQNEHSAEFNWNIQQLGGMTNGFYHLLGVNLGVFSPVAP